MSFLQRQKRTLTLILVLLPLLALFLYVGLRAGPLSPIAVTVASVKSVSITPSLFGIGIVEAEYRYEIGPTFSGRLQSINVQVGDLVAAGQLLGNMAPVDLDDKIQSQQANINRAKASLQEVSARQQLAQTQAERYQKLITAGSVSDEIVITKQQELAIANAAIAVTKAEITKSETDLAALLSQKQHLQLIAPVAGIVSLRNAEAGSTVMAGQTVIEIIDPTSLWVNVRFNQLSAVGLTSGLASNIVLRSRSQQSIKGKIARLELKADAVTEETLAKATFDTMPQPLPLIGELAEVTVFLPELAAGPVIPNAAIKLHNNQVGVWKLVAGDLQFSAITLGQADLNGSIQVLAGLEVGEQIVVYSEKKLSATSRVKVQTDLVTAAP